jgi:DNA-directed RNA polymerase sigma subunit (sigma70/sigma32)
MEASKKEMAVRHVINGRRIVARQRERVERLARYGLDTTEAKRTLDLFARTLNIFEDDLRQILADKWNKGEMR